MEGSEQTSLPSLLTVQPESVPDPKTPAAHDVAASDKKIPMHGTFRGDVPLDFEVLRADVALIFPESCSRASLAMRFVRLLDQRFTETPLLFRARGEDFGHGARLRKLFRESLAVAAGQRHVMVLRSHPRIRARRAASRNRPRYRVRQSLATTAYRGCG